MADSWYVRTIDAIDDIDGLVVQVGVDHDLVTIRTGGQTARLGHEAAEVFAQALIAASWEAARTWLLEEDSDG